MKWYRLEGEIHSSDFEWFWYPKHGWMNMPGFVKTDGPISLLEVVLITSTTGPDV